MALAEEFKGVFLWLFLLLLLPSRLYVAPSRWSAKFSQSVWRKFRSRFHCEAKINKALLV